MGFIELVGWFAISAIGFCLLLLYVSNKKKLDDEKDKLIANNDKCQALINRYNNSVIDEKPIMTYSELKKKLHQILKDPDEVQEALERIKWKEKLDEEYEQMRRERRKVGYKYEIEIFEIFDTNRELSELELISRIESKFNINTLGAAELLKLWSANKLVMLCSRETKYWKIGYTLTLESSNIDKTDLTRAKWLNQQGKTLKPGSKDLSVIDNLDLPF